MPYAETMDDILAAGPFVPVIALERAEDAVPLARALVAGGVRLLEVTLRTAAAPEAIKRIIAEVPEAVVGVGTLRNVADVAMVHRLGARFLVSPGTTERIYAAAKDTGLPFLPGCATASEILSATEHGFGVVKFFPAVEAGGLAAIRALRGPFGNVRFCPTGGIGEATFMPWLAEPGIVAVGGSWLAPSGLIKAGNWSEITAIAQRSLARLAP